MKPYIKLFLVLLFTVYLSCEDVIDLDVPTAKPRLVIDAALDWQKGSSGNNQSITLSYDVNPTSGGLSLFSVNTFGSTDPEVLIDYVQWGSANQARVNQAVTAGRWNNAE